MDGFEGRRRWSMVMATAGARWSYCVEPRFAWSSGSPRAPLNPGAMARSPAASSMSYTESTGSPAASSMSYNMGLCCSSSLRFKPQQPTLMHWILSFVVAAAAATFFCRMLGFPSSSKQQWLARWGAVLCLCSPTATAGNKKLRSVMSPNGG